MRLRRVPAGFLRRVITMAQDDTSGCRGRGDLADFGPRDAGGAPAESLFQRHAVYFSILNVKTPPLADDSITE
jgi:hypothetical protein